MKNNKAEKSKIKTSVALFADEDITGDVTEQNKLKGKEKQNATNAAKTKRTDAKKQQTLAKPDNKAKQINKSKSSKDSKPKQVKNSDKHNRTADDNTNNNGCSDSGTHNSGGKTVAKSGSRASGKIRTDKKPADTTVQKPKRSGTVVRKDIPTSETVKRIKRTPGKSVKNSGSNSKNIAAVKPRNTGNATRAGGKRKTKDGVGFTCGGTCKDETLGKAVPRLKRKYVRVNHIPSPCAIIGNPVPIKDDPFLVRITVNGEPRDVSPWSIKNKTYYPGLDSEFLVHCLNYIDPKRKKFKD